MTDERDPIDFQDGVCGDAAIYLLGLLDERHSASFLEHARGCSVCSDELDALTPAVEGLASSVPQLRASESSKQRVMEVVRAEADTRVAPTRQPHYARRPSRPLALAGVGLGLLLVVALAVLAIGISSSSKPSGSSARVIEAQVTLAGAKATLHVQSGHTWLTISGMPSPSPGHVYEVWVKYPKRQLPQATDSLFTPTSSGTANVEVPGAGSASEVMVTQEPAGGSRLPTSSPVIIARVT